MTTTGCSARSCYFFDTWFYDDAIETDNFHQFKGTVSKILSDPPWNTGTDSQQYLWNPYLINNVFDIVIFPNLKLFLSDNSCIFSCSRNAQVSLKIILFSKLQTFKSNTYLIRQSFQFGTVVNRTLSSLLEGTLEITRTASFRSYRVQ